MNNIERVAEAAEKRLDELAKFQAAVKTPDGEAIMRHLRHVTGADKSSFRPGDACATAFACGLRDAYLLMRRDAESDLSELAKKIKPNQEKDHVSDRG